MSRINCLSVASRAAPVKTTAARSKSCSGDVRRPRMSPVSSRRSCRTVRSVWNTASTDSKALVRNRWAVSVPGSPQAGESSWSSTPAEPTPATGRWPPRACALVATATDPAREATPALPACGFQDPYADLVAARPATFLPRFYCGGLRIGAVSCGRSRGARSAFSLLLRQVAATC